MTVVYQQKPIKTRGLACNLAIQPFVLIQQNWHSCVLLLKHTDLMEAINKAYIKHTELFFFSAQARIKDWSDAIIHHSYLSSFLLLIRDQI